MELHGCGLVDCEVQVKCFGAPGDNYDTFLGNLEKQKLSPAWRIS